MVNFESARRQILTNHFKPRSDDKATAAKIMGGKLDMPPHPTWNLPGTIQWTEDPYEDRNWKFQFHMLRWTDPLRRQGMAGNKQAGDAWERIVRSWIEVNPSAQPASKRAWVDMADGIRALALCYGTLLVGTPEWLIDSLNDHKLWLTDERHISAGNRGLHQNIGLLVLGSVLEDRDTKLLARQRLQDMFWTAWSRDGVNEEGALAYHALNLRWWREAIERLRREGMVPLEGAARLDRAVNELVHATRPDGKLVRMGDTVAASISGVDDDRVRYASSRGQRGRAPQRRIMVYPSGFAFARTGWGTTRNFAQEGHVAVTFGNYPKIHGHHDGGSLTYYSQGTPWLDHPGIYYYDQDPMRDYVLSALSHNRVSISGAQPTRGTSVELFSNESSDKILDLTTLDSTYSDTQIVRRLIYATESDLMLIFDKVEPHVPVRASLQWHTGLDIDVELDSDRGRLVCGQADLNFSIGSDTNSLRIARAETDPLLGWTATGWRTKEPVNVLVCEETGVAPRFSSVFRGHTDALSPSELGTHWDSVFAMPAAELLQIAVS